MKFRALIEPQILEFDAEDAYSAQNVAFALVVRDLSPSQVQVWPATEKPDWKDDARGRD